MRLPLPPGPHGHWLFGSLAEFRHDLLGLYTRCARDHGDCASFRLGPNLLCLVNHPDLIEQVLTNPRQFGRKTYILKLLIPFLGNSLLISEGDFWLRQRRMMQPEFHRQRIADYSVTMIDYANRMVDSWRDGDTRDLYADLTQLSQAIAAQALFGIDVADGAEVTAALDDAMAIFLVRWESLWAMPEFIPTPANLRMQRVTQRLDRIVFRMIEERRRTNLKRMDLLSRLLQTRDQDDGQAMSDRQLRDEVLTLYLAGFETTANALSWACQLIGQHAGVERRIIEEVRGLGETLTAESVARLTYTRAVFLEAMRLYPPAYALGRIAHRDCELGGFRVPRGTTIIISQWVTHRDARFFDDPLSFRPERWLDGLEERLHPYAYFPFGGGPRICIGKAFAMMEGPLVLATIFARASFRLAWQGEVPPKPSITLRPGLPIRAVVQIDR